MSMRRSRIGPLVAGGLLALSALVWPASAGAISQTATSNGATWLSANFDRISSTPGRSEDDRDWKVRYSLTFVDPGEALDGEGPVAGEADMRKPWVSIDEEHYLMPEGGGSGWLREVGELCSSFVNPDVVDGDVPSGTGPVNVSVEVPCDDGRGFDSYRVTWHGVARSAGPLVFREHAGWGWGSRHGGWHGGLNSVATEANTRYFTRPTSRDRTATLCGVKDGQAVECAYAWIAWGYLGLGLHAYAERNGDSATAGAGRKVPVFGSDPIVGGNPED